MTGIELQLLGSFDVLTADGASVASTAGTQRLLSLLALRSRTVSRAAIAGALWPEAPRSLGAVRLRAVLARINPLTRTMLIVSSGGVGLDPLCTVDYRSARALADRVLDSAAEATTATASETRSTIAVLCLELLPDFYDDWALEEAEEWRWVRAEALESLAASLARDARPSLAMHAAQSAVRTEPLRETAHAALVRLHISAGNHGEALRTFERFSTSLAEAVGVGPSTAFRELIATLPGQTTLPHR
ncbi:MAG: bacterial transcriptional activator domain-containing protein [Microcella sp.]|uniref:AfsR/SARP family transcriptional regulator n=1 Tax=Microcella sp. TaxID=1913979 RepID=UPI0033164744